MLRATDSHAAVRYRWYATLVGAVLLYAFAAWSYPNLWLPTVLPASGCLDRGWDAIQGGEYPTAEHLFAAAARKHPPAGLMPIARHVLYFRKWRDTPLAPRHIEILSHLPVLRIWMRPVELNWRNEDEMAGLHWLEADGWPPTAYRTLGVSCRVFDDHWRAHPAEVLTVVTAIDALRAGRPAQAYASLHRLETSQPALFRDFYTSAPLLLVNAADAARAAGHAADARRLQTLFRAQPPFEAFTYTNTTHWTVRIDPTRGVY